MARVVDIILQISKYLVKILFIFLVLSFCTIKIHTYFNEHQELLNSTFFERRKHISTDGPYFLYKKRNVEKINVVPDNNKFKIVKEVLTNKSVYDSKHVVNIYSYNNTIKDSFSFKIKDTIIIPQNYYKQISDIVAISDIEGNWYAFKKLLINSKVIDENYNWIFGDGHLVLVGDFVDRGLNVTQILWLIYKLESEAEKYGGKVHFILGNHEIMNLNNRIFHVRSKYLELADKLNLNYSKDLYGENSELGRWLRSKNSIEKMGDYLFVHGGIGPEIFINRLSMDSINNYIRLYIKDVNRQQKLDSKLVNLSHTFSKEG